MYWNNNTLFFSCYLKSLIQIRTQILKFELVCKVVVVIWWVVWLYAKEEISHVTDISYWYSINALTTTPRILKKELKLQTKSSKWKAKPAIMKTKTKKRSQKNTLPSTCCNIVKVPLQRVSCLSMLCICLFSANIVTKLCINYEKQICEE